MISIKLYKKIKKIKFPSSTSKIIIQLIWLTVLVILPQLFPEIIQLRYKTAITINILLAFISTIFYEFLKIVWKKRGKDQKLIVNLQLLTSIILLTWFLHLFGRINGPFFFLFLLSIMESAFNRDIQFINLMVAIAAGATIYEFTYLVLAGEIEFNLFFGVQLLIRLISLFFMRSYGLILGNKIASEIKTKEKVKKVSKEIDEAAERLRKANARLRQISNLKDEFISLTSHGLRTPLTAINCSLSTVLEGYAGKIDPKAKEFLEGAYDESLRLLRLVNNLLHISKIEMGKLKFHIKKLKLLDLIISIIEVLKSQAEEKKIKLVFYVDKSLKIDADEDKLKEMLINIIGNAIKFSKEGNKSIIAITAWTQAKTAIISIENTGRGILPEDQKRPTR